MKAPFPYYGGKAKWAREIWSRFGYPDVYVEPFAGSLAVLLANPCPAAREVVCDTAGYICNFWRAILAEPEKVAHHAKYPSIHQDLTARHKWLRAWVSENSARLSEDPEYYDVKVAGWWVWGRSNWIGRGFMHKEWDGMPWLGSRLGGQGIQLQSKMSVDVQFKLLAGRLEEVVVLNRGWESGVSRSVLLDNNVNSHMKLNRCVFLDPPYRVDDRQVVYESDFEGTSEDVAVDSWEWALEHGSRYKIAYCCCEDDFDVPEGWDIVTRDFGTTFNRHRTKRESVVFSPACAVPQFTLF